MARPKPTSPARAPHQETLDPGGGSFFYPPALVVSGAGFILSFLAFRPGAMTWDSFVMYGMGWEWPWHDWHTPYLALLMGVSRRLLGDPSGLLFVQLLLSWGGLYFTACGLRRQAPRWAAGLPLLGFTPMFLVESGYLHKTPLQAAVFLFAFGVLYHHRQWERRLSMGWTLTLALLLLLGIPLRVYGVACGLPLAAFLFCSRRHRSEGCPVARSLAAALLLTVTSLALHHLVVYQVLGAQRLHKEQVLYRYDLAAIYALTGVDPAPRMTREPFRSPARMQELYEQEDGGWQIVSAYEGGIPNEYLVPKDRPDRRLTGEDLAYYRDAWLAAVRRHPEVWLAHKAHAFALALGVGREMQGFRRAAYYRSRQNVFGLRMGGGVLYRALNRYMKGVRGSVLLKPWLWLAVTVALLLVASLLYRRRPGSRRALAPILVLLVSSALFYPQLFVTALDNDLRFSYWATVSCALALALLPAVLLGRGRGGHPPEAAEGGGSA